MASIWYCIVVLAFLFVDRSVCDCPDGSVIHDGSCYVIYHLKVTWSEALFYCKMLGTQLVTINTSEEQIYLANYLNREHKGAFQPGKFWTGLTTLLDSSWQWHSGSAIAYSNWAPNEPDDIQEKKCQGMGFDSNFKWYSASCENKFNFICESSSAVVGGSIIG